MAPYHDGIAGQAVFTYGHPSGREQLEAEKPILLAFAGGGSLPGALQIARLSSCWLS